jgi:multidrug efflux pump subunit AcrB
VHIWLPEGSSIRATGRCAEQVIQIVQETSPVEIDGQSVERLEGCTAFVGMGGPRLNLVSNPQQQLANYALILIKTTEANWSAGWVPEIRARTQEIPGTRIDVRPFKLGPYIENPVEFQFCGEDPDLLRQTAEKALAVLRATEGTVNPFHNWYNDGFIADVQVDPEKANLARVTNRSVAETMDTLISGGSLTTFREGDHPVPVMLRLQREQRSQILEDISEVYVDGAQDKVPLEAIAQVETTWAPACIQRKDTIRTISVGCQVKPGYLANSVAASARPQMEALLDELPATYRLEDGGELSETQESSAKIFHAFQLSGVLIVLVLIAQYNSLVKPLIVLFTVPLALIGALLGLFVTGWPLGFMPSLGIVSLAGVVINNAIILIDFIEANRREGKELNAAVADAGRQRMKPIVLTTLTTVGGLLPLALLAGPMWAGMAWAMIFGLALSTGLTLLVIPTLYAACVRRLKIPVR